MRAKVDEQDVSAVLPGQAANVSGEDLGAVVLHGHVALVGATAQKSDDPSNTSRQVVTTIVLDGSRPFLRDGMTVDVDIITVDKPHALIVPADAIRRDPAGKPYLLAVKDGRAVKRAITVEEVAALCLFLASDASSGITGAMLSVDGGTSPY